MASLVDTRSEPLEKARLSPLARLAGLAGGCGRDSSEEFHSWEGGLNTGENLNSEPS